MAAAALGGFQRPATVTVRIDPGLTGLPAPQFCVLTMLKCESVTMSSDMHSDGSARATMRRFLGGGWLAQQSARQALASRSAALQRIVQPPEGSDSPEAVCSQAGSRSRQQHGSKDGRVASSCCIMTGTPCDDGKVAGSCSSGAAQHASGPASSASPAAVELDELLLVMEALRKPAAAPAAPAAAGAAAAGSNSGADAWEHAGTAAEQDSSIAAEQQEQQQQQQPPVQHQPTPQRAAQHGEHHDQCWQLKKHRPVSPLHKGSQAALAGPVAAVKQTTFSFDGAQPQLAGSHYLRVQQHHRLASSERVAAAHQRPATAGCSSPSSPTTQQRPSPLRRRRPWSSQQSNAGGRSGSTATMPTAAAGSSAQPGAAWLRWSCDASSTPGAWRSIAGASMCAGQLASGSAAAALGGCNTAASEHREQLRVWSRAQDAITAAQQLSLRQRSLLGSAAAAAVASCRIDRPGTAAAAGAGEHEAAGSRSPGADCTAATIPELEQALAALMAGQPVPPDAAAALIAALSSRCSSPAATAACTAHELHDVITTINQADKPREPASMPQQTAHRARSSDADSGSDGDSGTDADCTWSQQGLPAALLRGQPPHRPRAATSPVPPAAEDLQRATAAFDARRFERYNQQLDAQMRQRAAEGDFDSDLEEEQQQQQQYHAATATAASGDDSGSMAGTLTAAEQKLQELAELQALWAEQDEWMDRYRVRPAAATHVASCSSDADDEREAADQRQPPAAEDPDGSSSAGLHASTAADTAKPASACAEPWWQQQQQQQQQHPKQQWTAGPAHVQPSAVEHGAQAELLHAELEEQQDAAAWCVRSQSCSPLRGRGRGRASGGARSRSLSPLPGSTCEQSWEPLGYPADAAKPRSIAAVKLAQDLAIKAREQEAALHHRFVASPVPPSTREPRYQRIVADQAAKRAASHEHYTSMLAAQAAPFSFHEREAAAAAAKAAAVAAACDPSRFQQPFKATPVPAHVHERRFEAGQAALEAARLAARVRAEMLRERASAKLQQEAKHRQELAEAAYQEHLADSASRGSSASPRRAPREQPGSTSPQRVPDFGRLHATWQAHLAAVKAANRRRQTTPQEFSLNGSTPQERAERERKAAQRRARILADIAADEASLPELRWPHAAGARARVSPTPPPLAVTAAGAGRLGGETLSVQLRAAAVQAATAAGRYDSTQERERKQQEALARQRQARQQQLQQLQQQQACGTLAQQQALQQPISSQAEEQPVSLMDAMPQPAAGDAAANADVAVGDIEAGAATHCGEQASQDTSAGSPVLSLVPPAAAASPDVEVLPHPAAAGRMQSSAGWLSVSVPGSRPKGMRHKELMARVRSSGGSSSSSSSSAVAKRRAALAGRQDAPMQHIEARHAQAERAAREMVRAALREHGINVAEW